MCLLVCTAILAIQTITACSVQTRAESEAGGTPRQLYPDQKSIGTADITVSVPLLDMPTIHPAGELCFQKDGEVAGGEFQNDPLSSLAR